MTAAEWTPGRQQVLHSWAPKQPCTKHQTHEAELQQKRTWVRRPSVVSSTSLSTSVGLSWKRPAASTAATRSCGRTDEQCYTSSRSSGGGSRHRAQRTTPVSIKAGPAAMPAGRPSGTVSLHTLQLAAALAANAPGTSTAHPRTASWRCGPAGARAWVPPPGCRWQS